MSNRKKKVNSASVKRENQENIREFIRKKRTTETQSSQRNIIDFINEDEDNFMYVQQVLTAFAEGFYDQPENINSIPLDLESYYQQHYNTHLNLCNFGGFGAKSN